VDAGPDRLGRTPTDQIRGLKVTLLARRRHAMRTSNRNPGAPFGGAATNGGGSHRHRRPRLSGRYDEFLGYRSQERATSLAVAHVAFVARIATMAPLVRLPQDNVRAAALDGDAMAIVDASAAHQAVARDGDASER
jgi:hypothetical protein